MAAYDIKIRRRALMTAVLPGLLWGLLWTNQARAEEVVEEPRWYQVELIIFAQRNDEALDSERWPEIAGVTLPENLRLLSLPSPLPVETPPPPTVAPPAKVPAAAPMAVPAPAPVPATEPFVILGDAELQLKDMAAKLTRSRNFEPLLHVAWRQPTLADEQTQPILLYDGMTAPYSEEEIAAMRAAQSAEMLGSPDSLAAEPIPMPPEAAPIETQDAETGPPSHRLIGTVRLSVARYLHLDADLLYRIPVIQKSAVPVPDLDLWYDHPYPTLREPQGPAYLLEEWQALRGFRLLESRRMRSKEIHYLDNPFFGVVVLVTPFELPAPETPKTPEIKKPALKPVVK